MASAKSSIAELCCQADVESAFRRVPLAKRFWKAAYIVFQVGGVAMAAMNLAVFFGASSSVQSWARVGALLAGILRQRVA